MSRIAVIGTGYVGLTTGACFAHLGHEVVCADIDVDKVARLQRGEIPILEAGLDEIVREGVERGRLSFVVGAAEAARSCEFAYLCVPTPQGDDGSADLSYIEAAAREIGPVLPSAAVVVNKSTVPVGSTRVVERVLGRDDVYVVSNPEFLREGSAVHDFLHPDRIVIGSEHSDAAIRVAALFDGLQAPLIVTDPASAETIKYASNAFLATKVSFVNAIANVCEAVGADVREVVLGMGYDKRIGFEVLKPGPGWGGSCFHPEESLLVRRGGEAALVTFRELFDRVEAEGSGGWEALTCVPGEPAPTFAPVAAFTAREFDGDLVEVRTKMGRRLLVTPDHPMIVGDGADPDAAAVVPAGALGPSHWLPVAVGEPFPCEDPAREASLAEALPPAGLTPDDVIVKLDGAQVRDVTARREELHWSRRRDVLRSSALRLSELRELGVDDRGGWLGTATNGTYVPATIDLDDDLWYVVGLYLAEGHITRDGRRERITWSFHPRDEEHLVQHVADFWRDLDVRVDVRSTTTSRTVTISSRILAAWFRDVLGLGTSSYTKRIPDAIWSATGSAKRALLRGLWDGDGSWSKVNGGPSVVLEYGTVSRALADGIVRLLAFEDLVARVKVGRTAKSTVDTYWLQVSGALQLRHCRWLLPADEGEAVAAAIAAQSKRTRPTGHRPISKSASWVRVTEVRRVPYRGPVHSVEVPGPHTVVSSFGLVAHNCFPKDSRALVHIAEEAGYEFDLLKGVVSVNEEQFSRVAAKIERMAGGSLDGAVVAVWGLTFKARTDDLRDSPALRVIDLLRRKGARVQAFDPAVSHGIEGIDVRPDAYAACDGAAVLAVLTEWDDFRWLDFDKVKEGLARAAVVDARNLLDPAALRRKGFTYEGIGR